MSFFEIIITIKNGELSMYIKLHILNIKSYLINIF